jgi:N-acetylglutamate synthase-like GNAT family acetyltransferase
VTVRVAKPSEYPRLVALYELWGYRGGITADDVVFVAERAGEVVGLVRRAAEDEITMLRGMYVAPAVRRSGVGTSLLTAFAEHLDGAECFCIPFAHLTQFYQQAGFTLLAEGAAPAMLSERLRSYRSEGHQVVLMHRGSDGRHLDRTGQRIDAPDRRDI